MSHSSAESSKNVSTIKAGKVVQVVQPWITAVNVDHLSTVCAHCWIKSENLSACMGCRYCFYCNRDCQRSHWKEEHKQECAMLKAASAYLSKHGYSKYRAGLPPPFVDLPILFLKALNRYTTEYPPCYLDLIGHPPLPYFEKPQECMRMDKVVLKDVKPHLPLGLRDYVSSYMKKSMTNTMTSEQCETLYRNTMMNFEEVRLGLGTQGMGGLYVGGALYLEPKYFKVACRGKCDWYFWGKTMVIKALVDMPKTRGLGDIVVAPWTFRQDFVTLSDRKLIARPNIIKNLMTPAWSCQCFYCSPAYEAEVNPVKCITESCMEPIPSDKRAREPCAQCGADNSKRLKPAQAQIKDFEARLGKIQGVVGDGDLTGDMPTCPCAPKESASKYCREAWTLWADIGKSRLLHPNGLVRISVAFWISTNIFDDAHVQERWRMLEPCHKGLKEYFCRHSDISPHYGKFMLFYGSTWCIKEGLTGGLKINTDEKTKKLFEHYTDMILKGRAIIAQFQSCPFAK